MSDEAKLKMALFRFGVIAPLVTANLTVAERQVTRAAVLEKVYDWPLGKMRPVATRTLTE